MIRPAVIALAAALVTSPALAAEAPAKKGSAPAKAKAKASAAPKEVYATFVTSQGKIGVRLTPETKPQSVANFVELAEGKKAWADPKTGQQRKGVPLYDGTLFHRVIPSFMIQGGDPRTRGEAPSPRPEYGTGNPGYSIQDEIAADEKFFEKPCQLAYANSGPNSSGSQFFITEVPTPHLNPRSCGAPSGVCGYVRFGEGVCGCELVAKIARLPPSSVKLEKVVISGKKPTCE